MIVDCLQEKQPPLGGSQEVEGSVEGFQLDE